MVCFGIEAWALRHASPGTVALFTALDPPITAVLSIVFLHEHAGVSLFAGGLLIICGLLVNAGVEEYVEQEGKEGAELRQKRGGELVDTGGRDGVRRMRYNDDDDDDDESGGGEESARLLSGSQEEEEEV